MPVFLFSLRVLRGVKEVAWLMKYNNLFRFIIVCVVVFSFLWDYTLPWEQPCIFCIFVKRILRHEELFCMEDDLNRFSTAKMGLEVSLGTGVNFIKLKLLTYTV